MIARLLATVLVAAMAASCQPTGTSRCVQSLCFDVPAETRLSSDGAKHTLRIEGWRGWIDVQVVEPLMRPPSDVAAAVEMLRRRHELLGNSRLIGAGASEIAGSLAQGLDLEIAWRGHNYRRLVFVLRHGTEWLTVDITSPAESVDEARRAWRPILRSATWARL